MRVLAIAAHPDDETLGCGGTLLKHRAAGDDVHWLVASSRAEPRWSAAQVEHRREQIEKVATEYQMSDVSLLGFPDAALDQVPLVDLVEGIDTVLANIRPEIVYVVHGGDVHSDHARVHTAAMSALKAFRMKALGTRRVLAYETVSSTEAAVQHPAQAFLPTVFNDITDHFQHKCVVMGHYDSEWQGGLLPRSPSALEALARWRGATVAVQYAEAFVLLRELS